MSLFDATHYDVTPRQDDPLAAYDDRIKKEKCYEPPAPPAPPPSPKLYPRLLPPHMDMHDLDQRIEAHVSVNRYGYMAQPDHPVLIPEAASRRMVLSMDDSDYKSSPLRRVTSADDADEIRNGEDDDDDDATMMDSLNPPSSRCSGATLLSDTLLSETGNSKRRFTFPSRTRKQQRPSSFSGDMPQSRPLVSSRQISSPIIDSSTVSPDIAFSSPKSTSSKAKSYPGKGSYWPSRPSPKIPTEVDTSHWSESDDDDHGQKKEPTTHVRIATFPSRGKRFRHRLSDLFCGS